MTNVMTRTPYRTTTDYLHHAMTREEAESVGPHYTYVMESHFDLKKLLKVAKVSGHKYAYLTPTAHFLMLTARGEMRNTMLFGYINSDGGSEMPNRETVAVEAPIGMLLEMLPTDSKGVEIGVNFQFNADLTACTISVGDKSLKCLTNEEGADKLSKSMREVNKFQDYFVIESGSAVELLNAATKILKISPIVELTPAMYGMTASGIHRMGREEHFNIEGSETHYNPKRMNTSPVRMDARLLRRILTLVRNYDLSFRIYPGKPICMAMIADDQEESVIIDLIIESSHTF